MQLNAIKSNQQSIANQSHRVISVKYTTNFTIVYVYCWWLKLNDFKKWRKNDSKLTQKLIFITENWRKTDVKMTQKRTSLFDISNRFIQEFEKTRDKISKSNRKTGKKIDLNRFWQEFQSENCLFLMIASNESKMIIILNWIEMPVERIVEKSIDGRLQVSRSSLNGALSSRQ